SFSGTADDRPVREGVGEGEPELHEVGAGPDRRLREGGSLGAAHEVDDERLGTILHSFVTHPSHTRAPASVTVFSPGWAGGRDGSRRFALRARPHRAATSAR